MDDAVNIINRDYLEDVHGVGDDIIRAAKEGEITDRDDFETYLHESIDSQQRVIYTFQAKLGLLVSDNASAGLEDGIVELSGDTIPWEQLMYAAMERDVLEYLDHMGFDPENPQGDDDED